MPAGSKFNFISNISYNIVRLQYTTIVVSFASHLFTLIIVHSRETRIWDLYLAAYLNFSNLKLEHRV